MPTEWCPTPPDADPTQDRKQVVGSPETASTLCHLGWRPLWVTGVLRQLLIQHFANPSHIEDPELRNLIWQAAASSGIMIESVYRWRTDSPEKRPAILVKRNAFTNLRVVLQDYAGTDVQGNDHYQTLWMGSHTLFCVHGTGASCEILATEVQRELTQFAPEIVRALDLLRFQITEVGAISELEESSQNYVVPVTVAWCYQEKWKLAPDALPLKSVALTLNPHDFL